MSRYRLIPCGSFQTLAGPGVHACGLYNSNSNNFMVKPKEVQEALTAAYKAGLLDAVALGLRLQAKDEKR